jgi:predicted Zn-dependent peptidase
MCVALLTGVFACCLFAGVIVAARADEAITSTDLANGLRVIVAPRHAVAIAAIDVWVRAGTRRQEQGDEGVAHYLEHVIFKGTPTRPDESDIDGAIEDLGGTLDGGTSWDWAHFYTVVPSAGFESALAVIADAIQHSTISQSAVEDERSVIQDEIDRDADDPGACADDRERELFFGPGHPYGGAITGTSRQVAAIRREQILAFYHKWYVPSNAAIVIAGDVTQDRAVAAALASFGSWKGDPAPAEQDIAAQPIDGIKRQIVNRAAKDSFMVMGWPAPSVSDKPDVWVTDVLLTYLGQGGHNVLDDDLHLRRHLVTAISSDFLTQRDRGILTIDAEFATADVDRVRDAILDHIRAVRTTPLTDAQLADAKQQLIASYLFDTETVSGKADALGFYEMIDSYQYDIDYVDHINSVTAAQVQNLAMKYLSPDAYAMTLVVPPTNPENASATFESGGHAAARVVALSDTPAAPIGASR